MNDKIEGPQRKRDDFLDPIVSREKRESIGRDAKWAAIALSAIALLGQQFLLNTETIKTMYAPVGNFLIPGAASLGDYISIGNTLMAAAPFIFVFAYFFVFLQGQTVLGHGHVSAGAVLLCLAAVLSNVAGFASVSFAGLGEGAAPIVTVVFMLRSYLSSYGLALFLSSLVVGVLFGRAWITLKT